MAHASKKRTIGSMLVIVVETTTENDDVDMESFGSSSDSDNDLSGSDSSEDEENNQSQNNDEHANKQEMVTRRHAKQIFEWGTGKVLMLSLDDNNRVIGNNAALFSSQLGILAKDGNKLPLTYTDWRAVPRTQKDMAWNVIMENTNLTDSYKSNCLKKLGKAWKDWKNRVKAKHFNPNKHDKSVLLAISPDRVEASQWPTLVNYWLSKKAKAINKKNKNSRENVKLPVRLGRKDFACAKEELRQNSSKEPSKSDLFIYSRKAKSEKPLDKETGEKLARLQELQQQLLYHLKDDIEANDEIYKNVVGKEAPGCLSGSKDPSKGKNLIFTSREEFDQAVQQKSSLEVASVQRHFEEEITKFKNDYCSKMEMLQARLNTIENQNAHVPGSSNLRHILAPNNGSSPQENNISESSQATENIEMTGQKTISEENNTNEFCGTSKKRKEKGDKGAEPTRRSKRSAI